jgi:hypothetical protein
VRACQQRPIQFSGWAFQLQRPLPSWVELQAASVWASIGLAVFCTMMLVSAAIPAGSSKLLLGWLCLSSHVWSPAWERLWAGLTGLIGMQLLMYSE